MSMGLGWVEIAPMPIGVNMYKGRVEAQLHCPTIELS